MFNGPMHDPGAHLDLVPRFRREIRLDRGEQENCAVVTIFDSGREFHTVRSAPFTEEMDGKVRYRMRQETQILAEAWLSERYPNWKMKDAYWN